MTNVPIESLRYSRDSWVRDAVDRDRVELFYLQLQEGAGFPPIEVVKQDDGTYFIGDGIHRCMAAQRAGHTEIGAVIVPPRENETPVDCAYRIALETATRGPLPLTMSERRRAVVHLLETQPEMSRRSIAELVGVSHSTVGRWAVEVDQSAGDGDEASPRMPIGPSPEKVARGLVGTLERLKEARGLFDYLARSRMGRHMAGAFADRYGESALDEARRFQAWVDAAVAALEEGTA